MRDESFTLTRAAGDARPPFTRQYIVGRRTAFWRIREASGRAVGMAPTRAGARAAVRALYGQSEAGS
ncbi:hypothetical protein [Phenylobacterium sp.]|uniref:hypothetical protein n=1 Tax=Phenylobacterium sp. TaxID=1871053 RepID=UPI002731CBD8|nr:hypothetical protein [Phenylobacterium sp.]MDP1873613.1 hypothetical protein [Phenylobacterium sp.]